MNGGGGNFDPARRACSSKESTFKPSESLEGTISGDRNPNLTKSFLEGGGLRQPRRDGRATRGPGGAVAKGKADRKMVGEGRPRAGDGVVGEVVGTSTTG